jgi:hypothetical protein
VPAVRDFEKMARPISRRAAAKHRKDLPEYLDIPGFEAVTASF